MLGTIFSRAGKDCRTEAFPGSDSHGDIGETQMARSGRRSKCCQLEPIEFKTGHMP